jgi:hypothetical protein
MEGAEGGPGGDATRRRSEYLKEDGDLLKLAGVVSQELAVCRKNGAEPSIQPSHISQLRVVECQLRRRQTSLSP